MTVVDGGPAFPQTNEQRYADPIHGVIRPSDIYGEAPRGMSLRDYFAAAALPSVLSASESFVAAAVGAYQVADCMLAQRENDIQVNADEQRTGRES